MAEFEPDEKLPLFDDEPVDEEAADEYTVKVSMPLVPGEELPAAFVEFVDVTLLQFLTHADKHSAVWCNQWQQHPDALHRLMAVWFAWIDVEAAPRAIHEFYKETLDYHLPYLVDQQRGAFSKCGTVHRAPELFGSAPTGEAD